MEVGCRVMAERWDVADAPPVTVATAYLVFVAVDVEGKPRAVRPVRPETPEDERRFREAEIRRAHRLAKRDAIQQSRDA
jgi:acyl-CoA hydrolase